MAHTWTNSGLSGLLAQWPKSAIAQPGVTYVGLFASQTSGTVPNRTAFGTLTPGGWTEVTGGGYGRQVISAANWGAQSASGNGVMVTAAPVVFSAAGTWAPANGFFLSTHVSSQANDNPYFFANFDSLLSYTLTSATALQVTPLIQFNVSAGA